MSTYTVIAGDTMWHIAKKHNMELNDLLAANPQITNSALIFPGQTINIPGIDTSTYKVMSGDTMWHIAKKHNMELNDLIAANPQITNSNLIFPGQTINIPNVPNDIRALENEVVRLVNVEREKIGHSPLTQNNEVSRAARIKSQDFINKNYFSHNSPTYGTPFDMLKSFGITFTSAAENIASGQRTATEAMNSWMSSPSHRANILNSAYNQIGVGVAKDNNGKLYWTQILIRS